MVGWHHQLSGHEFEQTPGVSEGQGSLVCCSPRGHRVRHSLVTEQQQKDILQLYAEGRRKKQAVIILRVLTSPSECSCP